MSEEERAIQDVDENIDDDAEKQDDLNISGKADDSASDEDDGDEGMEPTGSVVKKDTTGDSKPQARKASAQQKKHFSIIVAQSAKRLGLASKSDVGKKCMSLFSADTDTKMVTPHTETVNSWTGRGSVQSTTFFPWPNQHTSQVHTTNSSLASPSLGVQLVELCEKCVGHTAFLPIMQGGELGAVRGELVSLLACLVRLEKKCCSALPLKAFLAAYSATLSLTGERPGVCCSRFVLLTLFINMFLSMSLSVRRFHHIEYRIEEFPCTEWSSSFNSVYLYVSFYFLYLRKDFIIQNTCA